ncbi:MAG: FAD-dependent monooxygenase [Betaproteobacteria bacterium]
MPLPLAAPLAIAVVGAGPVGLALALHAARMLPAARITLYDARPADLDVAGDPRTIALSLGSVQLLERLGAWDAKAAQPIVEVRISQQPPTARLFGHDVELRIRARDEGVPLLGAVLAHGRIVAPLQAAWLEAVQREPQRLQARFGTAVRALKDLAAGVEIDAGIAEAYDLAVVAEGGVFADVQHTLGPAGRRHWRHDYRQTAWVGQVTLEREHGGTAWERFTRYGPAALLPLPRGAAGAPQTALVWCVARDDDPVAELTDAQRLAVLDTVFPAEVGPLVAITPLKAFPLGLHAERSLVGHAGDASAAVTRPRVVRIGNAAQKLHPVAGQGLNLGLRDAVELVHALDAAGPAVDAALRRVEWQRAPDRLSMIAATDFLARSFTWVLPGAGLARGLGLAALQALGPARSLLARQMMFGMR